MASSPTGTGLDMRDALAHTAISRAESRMHSGAEFRAGV